jgi:glutamyl-tRNA reductase
LLKENPVFKGGVILSTCNRVELYASVKDLKSGIEELEDFLSIFKEIAKGRVLPYLYVYQEEEAIKHLFLVASGLDSLILGETQVLDQVRRAFEEAKEAYFTDIYLEAIFNAALTFAGKMQERADIFKESVSIGSVAIDFIKDKLGGLSEKKVLLIGVGKVAEIILRYLEEEKPEVIFVSNRTFEKAKELALRIGQRAVRFDEFEKFLREAEVVVSATSSPHFIIKKENFKGRLFHQLLILDLAMPRDVDPQVQEIEGIELFNLEEIAVTAQKNLTRKTVEAEKIKALINREAHDLWQKVTAVEPELALLP